MKEFGDQEVGEKMSCIKIDATWRPGLKVLLSKRETPESELSILFTN